MLTTIVCSGRKAEINLESRIDGQLTAGWLWGSGDCNLGNGEISGSEQLSWLFGHGSMEFDKRFPASGFLRKDGRDGCSPLRSLANYDII